MYCDCSVVISNLNSELSQMVANILLDASVIASEMFLVDFAWSVDLPNIGLHILPEEEQNMFYFDIRGEKFI